MGKLQQSKLYPTVSREREKQGVAMVNFTMDRNGRILAAAIMRSSGSDALDQEAIAMIYRAEPLPPLPPEMTSETLKLTIPVSFSLR